MVKQVIVYKEWAPDQPVLGYDGMIEATNVLPRDDGYTPFHPLNDAYNTTPGISVAIGVSGATKGSSYVYGAFGGLYYKSSGTNPTGFTTVGSYTTGGKALAQFDNIVFAAGGAGHRLAQITLGAVTSGGGSTLAAITGSPYADVLGVVGQFLIAGSLYTDTTTPAASYSNYVQWSAIADPANWPIPGSATAIAAQSGQQALYEKYGAVHSIHGGDQFGVILQQRAVTRMTYVGGSAVFQFDLIDNSVGSAHQYGSCRVGGLTYFISRTGFCRTDGGSVERIGAGKVDDYWLSLTPSGTVSCAYDSVDELIYFGNGSYVFVFNPNSSEWTICQQDHKFLLTAPTGGHPLGFGNQASPIIGQFAATAGAAVLTTGESEFNTGGFARVTGVRPLVIGASAITVAVGSRNDLGTAASFTSETSAGSRSGIANFRSEARYHRIRTTITGEFTKAIGYEIDVLKSGEL